MEQSLHEQSRAKICLCGKRAFRLLKNEEKEKINQDRTNKIDFDRPCYPYGVCRKCEVCVRREGKLRNVAYWDSHVSDGTYSQIVVRIRNTLNRRHRNKHIHETKVIARHKLVRSDCVKLLMQKVNVNWKYLNASVSTAPLSHALSIYSQDRATRSNACSKKPCFLCKIAHSRGAEAVSLQKKVNSPPEKKAKKKVKLRRCHRCLWPIYRGNHHRCSKRARLKNIKGFINENEKEIITHECLSSRLIGKRSHSMRIRTGGRPAHYTVQRGFVKQRRVSLSTIRKARAETGISGRNAERFISLIRSDLGNDAIEPGLHNDLIASNRLFISHFKQETVLLEVKTESAVSKQKRLLQLQDELAAMSKDESQEALPLPSDSPSSSSDTQVSPAIPPSSLDSQKRSTDSPSTSHEKAGSLLARMDSLLARVDLLLSKVDSPVTPIKSPSRLIGSSPMTINSSPLPMESSPLPIESSPMPMDSSPMQIDSLPIPMGSSPIPMGSSPMPTDSSPMPMDSSPMSDAFELITIVD